MKAAALAAGMLLALGGCVDLGLVREVAFPPGVPGLQAGQPWVTLPVGAWETEGEVQPVAIAACFSEHCAVPAAVGVFRARGRARTALLRDAGAPERLARSVLAGRSARAPRTVATAEPIREAGMSGFLLVISRPDGSHAAAGVALASPDGGTVTVVVARTAAAARSVARDVAAGLG